MKLLLILQLGFVVTLPDCHAVRVYQCGSDFKEQTNPAPMTPDNRRIRICIEGTSTNSAIKCQRIVEATIRQSNNSMEDTLIVAGQISQEKMAVDVTFHELKCMMTARIPDRYFVKSATTTSLQISISGSASLNFSSKVSKVASSAGRHLRENETKITQNADLTDQPFEVAVNCLEARATELVRKDEVSATNGLGLAYQCTSDYEKLDNPPAISPENRFVRVCIGERDSAVDCQRVLEATITQTNNNSQDRLVAAGQVMSEVEAKAQGSRCTLAALLDRKYFTKSGPTASLTVNISGSVSVSDAMLYTTEQIEVPFWILVTLTQDDDSGVSLPDLGPVAMNAGVRPSIVAGLTTMMLMVM